MLAFKKKKLTKTAHPKNVTHVNKKN
jgi:hypothetical protein